MPIDWVIGRLIWSWVLAFLKLLGTALILKAQMQTVGVKTV